VPLTHDNLFWCGSAGHEGSDVSGATSTLVPLPLAHAYGLLVTCIGTHTTEPTKLLLMRWFDPAGWLDLAVTQRAERSALVPSMIQMLLSQPLESSDLSALVAISSGAAPLAESVRKQFESRVPSVQIQEGYGCTESASIISSNPFGRRRVGSVGLPVPGCQVTIRDDNDKDLPVGEDGEICAKSAGVMSGYWNSPDATAATVIDGWLHTGDIGHLDEDGYLFLTDRRNFMIISGGVNIYPQEIENLLITHPKVADVAVVGEPDEELGEKVIAVIQPSADVVADSALAQELLDFARAELGSVKAPKRVDFRDELPREASGKLLKSKLVAEYHMATPG
jgi:long-chain acyl-CoA synthetase